MVKKGAETVTKTIAETTVEITQDPKTETSTETTLMTSVETIIETTVETRTVSGQNITITSNDEVAVPINFATNIIGMFAITFTILFIKRRNRNS